MAKAAEAPLDASNAVEEPEKKSPERGRITDTTLYDSARDLIDFQRWNSGEVGLVPVFESATKRRKIDENGVEVRRNRCIPFLFSSPYRNSILLQNLPECARSICFE